jgi:hypothetical protein
MAVCVRPALHSINRANWRADAGGLLTDNTGQGA